MYYPGLYAGQTDLVCMHNGVDAIVDFKQSGGNKDELLELLIKCYNYCLRPKSKHISNKVLN